jgi:hypothetical protein
MTTRDPLEVAAACPALTLRPAAAPTPQALGEIFWDLPCPGVQGIAVLPGNGELASTVDNEERH